MGYTDLNLYGSDGPIATSLLKSYLPLSTLWIETMDGLGLKMKKDPFYGGGIGAFTSSNFIDPGKAERSHDGVAYWEPIGERTNLHLKEKALVEKVLLEKDEDGVVIATAVQYSIDGERRVSRARKEIILAAGTFGSPAILEMSGIGDEKLLKELGINVVLANRNVGENLQDHPMTIISAEVSDPEQSLDSLRDPKKLQATLALYQEKKDGAFTTAGFNAMSFLSTCSSMTPEELQDLGKTVEECTKDTSQLSAGEKLQFEYLKSLVISPTDSTTLIAAAPAAGLASDGDQPTYGISIISALLHPFSRGSSHIESSDANTPPKIDPKYLAHPLDLEILARHLLFSHTVLSAAPLKSILKPHGRTNVPGGIPKTIDEARAWATNGSRTQSHPCGTCAMMSGDMGGVVNDRLRVHGTKNLRVIDASIFPIIPGGLITSSVYAVAERACDLILEDLKAHVD